MVKVTVNNSTKPFWESKTFYVAIVATLIGILQWVQGQIDAGASLTVMGVLMASLRAISNQGLTIWKE